MSRVTIKYKFHRAAIGPSSSFSSKVFNFSEESGGISDAGTLCWKDGTECIRETIYKIDGVWFWAVDCTEVTVKFNKV